MNRFLDISRAARLAGVPREEIQHHIAEGTLEAFEGKVEVSKLLVLYPELERNRASMLEVVSQIKEDALAKDLAKRYGMQDPASLAEEVRQLREELAHHKKTNDCYRQIILDLKRMLLDLQDKVEQKQRVEAIHKWLESKTKNL